MDSKMDSGYLGSGESYAKALEYDYDVMRELQPEEVLGLMDQLLCHEVCLPCYIQWALLRRGNFW